MWSFIFSQKLCFFEKILQKIANYNSESENFQNVKREKPLSMGELEMVRVILHHMNHVFENFGKMWRGGKYVEASDVAEAQYKVAVDLQAHRLPRGRA